MGRSGASSPRQTQLGQTYDLLGKYGPAEKHLRRSIEIAPEYGDSYYDLGNMFLKIKDKRKEAKTLLERAVELDPEMTWGYYCLGCWYSLEGRKTKAFEYLEKAFEKGFSKREWMEADKNLDALRADPRYAKMITKHFASGAGGESGAAAAPEKKNKAKK
jgi:tetratricopeptide (TPR) repeat protein